LIALTASAGVGLLATENTERDYGIERLGTASMNVLYKYCDKKGIEIILRTLELKLPYIPDVNDPYECLPVFYCPDDKPAMKEQWLRTFERNRISPPVKWEQILDEEFEKGEIQKKLKEEMLEKLRDFNQKSCLLSVSKTAQNAVMWAHYTEQHKGAVIGIDFNNVYPDTNGPSNLTMHSVKYSKDRIKINVLSESKQEEFEKVPLTKSIDWSYEEEFRAIFPVNVLRLMRQKKLAYIKDLDGKDIWFLRLNPVSIREVIFGLYTDESLKSDIRKLIERQDLQHIKLYQAEESETYTLNLK